MRLRSALPPEVAADDAGEVLRERGEEDRLVVVEALGERLGPVHRNDGLAGAGATGDSHWAAVLGAVGNTALRRVKEHGEFQRSVHGSGMMPVLLPDRPLEIPGCQVCRCRCTNARRSV